MDSAHLVGGNYWSPMAMPHSARRPLLKERSLITGRGGYKNGIFYGGGRASEVLPLKKWDGRGEF